MEGGFARLFAGRLHPREVAVHLARAMEDHAYTNDSVRTAPDVFIVRLNPEDHEAVLAAQPELVQSLIEELTELARLSGLHLHSTPEVRLIADSLLPLHQVAVSAQVRADRADTTEGVSVDEIDQMNSLPKAALILNGNQYVPIDKPILNLGRHRDNDIIVENPHVSRHHAQIRLRFGRFMLFDLASSKGTSVNGKTIREAVLQPGDVITLADVTLIYVEESPAPPSSDPDVGGSTQPFPK